MFSTEEKNMKKEKIKFDQLAVLSMLKFGKLDSVDMTLLKKMISPIVDVEMKENIDNYYVTGDGTIVLSSAYIEKFNKNIKMSLFESVENSFAKHYIDNIDVLEFVLRKIKLHGYIPIDKEYISDFFSVSEIVELKKLIKGGYLIDYWKEECIYDDYYVVELTKKGEVSLFSSDNGRKIDAFFKNLGIEYDEGNKSIKEDFLMTQNLDLKVRDILNIDSFIAFCRDYDRAYPKGYSLLRSKKSEKNNNID